MPNLTKTQMEELETLGISPKKWNAAPDLDAQQKMLREAVAANHSDRTNQGVLPDSPEYKKNVEHAGKANTAFQNLRKDLKAGKEKTTASEKVDEPKVKKASDKVSEPVGEPRAKKAEQQKTATNEPQSPPQVQSEAIVPYEPSNAPTPAPAQAPAPTGGGEPVGQPVAEPEVQAPEALKIEAKGVDSSDRTYSNEAYLQRLMELLKNMMGNKKDDPIEVKLIKGGNEKKQGNYALTCGENSTLQIEHNPEAGTAKALLLTEKGELSDSQKGKLLTASVTATGMDPASTVLTVKGTSKEQTNEVRDAASELGYAKKQVLMIEDVKQPALQQQQQEQAQVNVAPPTTMKI